MANKYPSFRHPGRYWVIYGGEKMVALWKFNGNDWYWYTDGSNFGKHDEDMSHIYPERIPEPGERSRIKNSAVVNFYFDNNVPMVKGANGTLNLLVRIESDGTPHPEHARDAAIRAVNEWFDKEVGKDEPQN